MWLLIFNRTTCEGRNNSNKLYWVNRLRYMKLEARGQHSDTVLCSRIGSERNRRNSLGGVFSDSKCSYELITIAAGHCNVGNNDIRPVFNQYGQCFVG